MCCSAYSLICEVQEYAECMRDGAEEDSISSSKDSTYLFAVEQGDQFVRDAKLPALQCRRYPRVHGFKLFSGISSGSQEHPEENVRLGSNERLINRDFAVETVT